MSAMFDKDTLRQQPVDFRIGAVISDGMWYSQPKWRKLARVTEQEIDTWIEEHLADGSLVQSPTGAKSYRFPLESIHSWYDHHGLQLGVQLIESIFPPRIWDGMTETEGFLSAPLRRIGVVSFKCQGGTAEQIRQRLRGVARVREQEPGRYKAYSLSSTYTKEIVQEELRRLEPGTPPEVYPRKESKRRELVDFTPEFSRGLVLFYRRFGKTLVKKNMETIQIFVPDPEDQESQVVLWVMNAIERFDESASVPFSGYLNTLLTHQPFDLASAQLGKELSSFQRRRARAIDTLRSRHGDGRNFTAEEMAKEMEMEVPKFNDMEDRHHIWTRSRNATTLTWDENSDEKSVATNLSGDFQGTAPSDMALAHRMSQAVIQAALGTRQFEDALTIIAQIDSSEINMDRIQAVSEDFIMGMGSALGVEGD